MRKTMAVRIDGKALAVKVKARAAAAAAELPRRPGLAVVLVEDTLIEYCFGILKDKSGNFHNYLCLKICFITIRLLLSQVVFQFLFWYVRIVHLNNQRIEPAIFSYIFSFCLYKGTNP